MPTVTADDVARMRGQLFVEGPQASVRRSRFWTLLILASVIATAGVVADSTATVIGAMIVAPLMTPILGIVLAIVLGDRGNLFRSIGLVIGGALTVIAIAWCFGRLISLPVTAATNSQVAGRVHPRLVDLVAALATGVVGSFALVRSDISDTLPGVAIAISLVPPLAVVGLTLESGSSEQAAGALLLFGTNVAAILATGVVVMAVFGVHRMVEEVGALNRRNVLLLVGALIVLIGVPLVVSSLVIARESQTEYDVSGVARVWAADAGWEVLDVSTTEQVIAIRAVGPGAAPDPQDLRRRLDEAGLKRVHVKVKLAPEQEADLLPQ